MSTALRRSCETDPGRTRRVVVTLTKSSENVEAAALGAPDLEAIEGLKGIFKGSLTGKSILDLGTRPEVEAIELDQEFHALSNRAAGSP